MQDGVSSLVVASQNGNVEVVEKLLEYGARVNLHKKVCMQGYGFVVYCSRVLNRRDREISLGSL